MLGVRLGGLRDVQGETMKYRHVLDEDTCGNRERCISPPQVVIPPPEPAPWKCEWCQALNSKDEDDCHECGRERPDVD